MVYRKQMCGCVAKINMCYDKIRVSGSCFSIISICLCMQQNIHEGDLQLVSHVILPGCMVAT